MKIKDLRLASVYTTAVACKSSLVDLVEMEKPHYVVVRKMYLSGRRILGKYHYYDIEEEKLINSNPFNSVSGEEVVDESISLTKMVPRSIKNEEITIKEISKVNEALQCFDDNYLSLRHDVKKLKKVISKSLSK